jgi:hypothetical protein
MATQDQWAFLLQHADDRTWIHLDLPDMVVLAGRYRIIARSLRRNVDAEISIAHTSLPADRPQRRTKKRAAKTNDKGFLLVLPFTDMQPGAWEFRCAGDVMSELIGESWQHTVQLNVQPQSPIPLDISEPDWAPIGPATPIIPAAPAAVHAIATIDPVTAELEAIFTPIDTPTIPPTDPVVPDPILGNDALSLEDLFGDPAATVDLVDPSQDLASELAAIGQPAPEPEPDLEVDVWSTPDELATPASLTQLEVVSNNDETLLDWDATSLMRPAASAAPASTHYDRAAMDGDDDFSVFDELFATPIALTNDRTELGALLSADSEPADEDDNCDVITFTDADAMAVTAETDHPIDLALETDLVGANPTPAPSRWGIGTRTGAHDVQGIVPAVKADDVSPIATSTTNITASPANVAALIDASEILTEAIILDATVLATETVPETATATATATSERALGHGELPYLMIDLDPSFYNFRGGEMLMIYGQINAETLPAVIAQGELVVNLIDPQTATQVAEYRQTLDRQALPMTIAAPLSVPAGLNVQLLVGEVALWDDGVEELAQQTFTAMAALDDLMASIDPNIVAEEFEKAPKVVPTGGDAPLPPVDFAFFNLIGDAPENAAELAPLKKRESMKDVELPGATPESFGTIAPIDELDESIFAVDDIELEHPLAPTPVEPDRIADPTSTITSTSGQPLPDDWFDLAADDQPTPDQPTDNIAVDVVEPLVDAPPKAVAAPVAIAEPPIEAVPISNPDPAASEVVVDDLPEALPTPQAVATLGNPLLIPADQPIPEPTIEIVDDGELITGQSVRVRVKLPNILPKLYVKLWINDRQSRTLMDGPRWMVDFMPNGRNELETMTQLTVPFGSLEIQIAAIAVEALTKRESYRTAIDRTVIPPNLEDDLAELNFDQF